MGVSRRQFLKLSGASAITLAIADLGFNAAEAEATASLLKFNLAKKYQRFVHIAL